MARPIWNGTISFGLLNVRVQLYSGERSLDQGGRSVKGRKSAAKEKRSRKRKTA